MVMQAFGLSRYRLEPSIWVLAGGGSARIDRHEGGVGGLGLAAGLPNGRQGKARCHGYASAGGDSVHVEGERALAAFG